MDKVDKVKLRQHIADTLRPQKNGLRPEDVESSIRQRQRVGIGSVVDGGTKFYSMIAVSQEVRAMASDKLVVPSGKHKWKLTNKGRREVPKERAAVEYELGDVIEATVNQCRTHQFVIVAMVDGSGRRNPLLVANLSGKSNGKSAYTIKYEQIKRVIRKEPNHPWIWSASDLKNSIARSSVYTLKGQSSTEQTEPEPEKPVRPDWADATWSPGDNRFLDPPLAERPDGDEFLMNTLEDESHKIIVEKREGDWYAEIENHPEWFSLGDTAPDAIGKLVVLHGSNFGLTIKPKE